MKRYKHIPLFLFFFFGLLNTIGLLLYSYTQVDLNLTLSKISIWQTIQKSFQSIGYFYRPVSLWIYIGILLSMFCWYIMTLHFISVKKIRMFHMVIMIICMTGVLVFAYPAFSYDLFNHMFTAKSVLLYGKNPYEVTPLQFSGYESWLTFMRWTHVVSIYSPLWIGMTFIPYIFGFGYFLWILWNFKLCIALFYIMAVYFIGKILEEEKEEVRLFGIAAFALNPLVIIESLVSAHNDIVMMGFAVFGYYALQKRKFIPSFFLFSLSIASKLMTIILLPIIVIPKNKWFPLVLMSIGTIGFLFVTKREIMPWYLLWTLPFIALLPKQRWLVILWTGMSLGLLLRYAPYLYFGHWNDPVPVIKFWVTAIPVLLTLCISVFDIFIHRKVR